MCGKEKDDQSNSVLFYYLQVLLKYLKLPRKLVLQVCVLLPVAPEGRHFVYLTAEVCF